MKRHTLLGRAAAVVALALAAALTAGCAGYRVGSQLPPNVRRLYIPTVENLTGEPLIEDEITRALIAEIQRDGALRIAPAEQADAVLRMRVRRFDLAPIAYRQGLRSEPDEYRLTLEASFVVTRAGSDAVVVEHPAARGEGTAMRTPDFSAAKRVALPIAARDLARDVARKLVENW